MENKHQILIIGGGNAGISVASKLLLKDNSLNISIIEPSEKHYYQPAWTLVGAGDFNISDTVKAEKDFMPKEVNWIKDSVVELAPKKNQLTLKSGTILSYEFLIVAPGIQLNWDEIKGLKETLGKNNVTSNYSFETAPYTFECLKNFKGGNAIFHTPNTPIKCGGAPMKIMFMASDYLKKHNLLNKTKVAFWSGGTRIFAVEKYENTFKKVFQRYGITPHFHQKLVEIDGPNKRAKFIGLGPDNKDVETWVDFDFIHVTPPQSAPDFVRNSSIANAAGWVDVDKNTLQHITFKNIFSLGDASSLPTSKTGAAIRKQAPVLVENLLATLRNQTLTASYNGYTSCPVLTGYGKLVLAEFDYTNTPTETFPFDQSKERYSMYLLKKYILPFLYWTRILQGKM
jgi:sulfide:quinone oxidoreductase